MSSNSNSNNNNNNNNNNDDDLLPSLRRNSDRPGLTRRIRSTKSASSSSRRSFVDLFPITPTQEFIAASMSQQDLMTAIRNDAKHSSMRYLDVRSVDHATAISTRQLDVHKSTTFKEVEQGSDDKVVTTESKETIQEDEANDDKHVGCWKSFDQDPSAKGQAYLKIAHGTIYMSNAFLSTSLLYFALVEAGCVDEMGASVPNCEGEVYGFKPASLITNIAVVSGLLAAFFAPVLGAVIDHTPHRRKVGIISAGLLTLIQGVQVYTVYDTWFAMAILQAIAGFILPIQLMATYAYLPEIARNVGGDVMNHYSKWFQVIGFFTQIAFSCIVLAATAIFALNTAQIAQVGQGLSAISLFFTVSYAWGWSLPDRPKNKELPPNHSLWLEGFRTNYRTAKTIFKHYSKGLKWFLLANTVADAGVTAIFPIIITFLIDQLRWGNTQIALWAIVVLITAIPGCFIGATVTSMTNPKTSWILSMVYMIVMVAAAAFTLNEERSYLGYVFGALWGIFWGWYFPVSALIFSLCLPSGSENEMTGLYVYTTLILQWLPSLLFSIIIEAGADIQYGFLSLIIFQVTGIAFMLCMSPWDEVLEEAEKVVGQEENGDGEEGAAEETPAEKKTVTAEEKNGSLVDVDIETSEVEGEATVVDIES